MTVIRPAMITAPELLAKVSAEFGALSAEIESLQDTLSTVLARAQGDAGLMEKAQALDHVFQHMSELGAVLGRAADQASADWQMSAHGLFGSLTLSNLAARLSGATPEAAASGDLDMF